ncbi:type II toxin-antitoxin system mRNA interferase toxin, RelE/StbE family [Pseudactinotalea sp. HY160]|uniref:type II toxin-antitoxin system RelE family toxin n=1 Tax=Pseudactinotalea sp. HY160 TaxID=2654490 RepID=UPI0013111411|nr:type II toxin-antitoxin system mRNA interferase toxin, RelE/StbE family [Pseudactinotalea sp. HY160]
MTWEVELSPEAARWLRKADPQTARRVRAALRAITTLKSPRDRGAPLTGGLAGLWRYRVGDYRIICDLRDERLVVLVIEIGHRRGVYE